MKHIHLLIFLFIFMIVNSCKSQNKIVLEGSVYIKQIDLGSLYNSSEKDISSLKKQINEFDDSKRNESEKLFYTYYKVLFKENLIDKPCLLMKDNKGNIKRVFFSFDDYKIVEPLLSDLDKNNEQINLSLEVSNVNEDLYFVIKIIKLEKVKGKTDWSK